VRSIQDCDSQDSRHEVSSKSWTEEQAWYGNPAYGVLRYILVLAACGRHVDLVRRCPVTLELLI
jgi:hypothetical protein